MGKLTNYATNKWLNHILEGSAFTKPTALWFAYSTTDFTATGAGGSEPVGNNYGRTTCLVKFATPAANRIVSNDGDIVAAQASGSQGTIAYWALFDAETDGNCLCYGAFATGKAVGANQTLKVLTGEIDISIPTGGFTDYLANGMLDHTFVSGGDEFTQPTIYMALATTTSFGDAGAWTNETSTAGGTLYARIASAWTVSGTGATNNGALTFPVAGASWGNQVAWALADGDTEGAGNMLFYHAKAIGTIGADDQVNIPDGDLDFTFTG